MGEEALLNSELVLLARRYRAGDIPRDAFGAWLHGVDLLDPAWTRRTSDALATLLLLYIEGCEGLRAFEELDAEMAAIADNWLDKADVATSTVSVTTLVTPTARVSSALPEARG